MKDYPEQILNSMRRLVRVLRIASSRAEQELGISGAQLFVLRTLAQSSKPLSLTELSEKTLTHLSSVSVVVNKLCNRGYIQKTTSPKDARKMELQLSARGQKFFLKSPETPQEHLVAAVQMLSEEKQMALADLLSEVLKASGFDNEDATMFFE